MGQRLLQLQKYNKINKQKNEPIDCKTTAPLHNLPCLGGLFECLWSLMRRHVSDKRWSLGSLFAFAKQSAEKILNAILMPKA